MSETVVIGGNSIVIPDQGDPPPWGNGITRAIVALSNNSGGVLFSQTSTKTVANTTAETSIVGTGLGSATIAANTMAVGQEYTFTIGGTCINTGPGTDVKTIINLGSVNIATSDPHAFGSGGLWGSSGFSFFVLSIGATGSIFTYGASGFPTVDNSSRGIITVNTTVDNLFDFRFKMSDALPGSSLTSIFCQITVKG